MWHHWKWCICEHIARPDVPSIKRRLLAYELKHSIATPFICIEHHWASYDYSDWRITLAKASHFDAGSSFRDRWRTYKCAEHWAKCAALSRARHLTHLLQPFQHGNQKSCLVPTDAVHREKESAIAWDSIRGWEAPSDSRRSIQRGYRSSPDRFSLKDASKRGRIKGLYN